jgi:hypothetical protein
VFQTKKVRKAMPKIFFPLFFSGASIIASVLSNSGTNATNRSGAVKDIGGQASHNRRAVVRAFKYNFFTLS